MEAALMEYMYGDWPDKYMNSIEADGGVIFFRSQEEKGRAVVYAGEEGSYRAIHSCFVFGAMKDALSSHSKAEIMAAYMRYLLGHSLVVGLESEMSVSQQVEINLLLEAGTKESGRGYAVLGSLTGTEPGIPVGSVVLPLNYDFFMEFVVSLWNTPVFMDFFSTLDSDGRNTAFLDNQGSLDPGLLGITMYYAYLLIDPMDFASNAVAIPFVP